MPRTKANGIDIEYDCFGNGDAPAVLLISGLGTQMICWSDTFCRLLADQGFRVIRFDNRDAGLSTQCDSASMPWSVPGPVPDLAAIAGAVARGETPDVPYTLVDMANDAVGLLDALRIEGAHLVGRSMGGMIGQLVASAHPGRVLSLVSIMSSTGKPALPQASAAVMAAMTSAAPDPLKDEQAHVAHCVAFARLIAGRGYPFDEAAQRAHALTELRRARNPAGFWRQIAAVAATGDLRPRLGHITAPTLVLHGADDPLVPPEAGKDTAASIGGAELRIVAGMGHAIPSALSGAVASLIAENARRARTRRRTGIGSSSMRPGKRRRRTIGVTLLQERQ